MRESNALSGLLPNARLLAEQGSHEGGLPNRGRSKNTEASPIDWQSSTFLSLQESVDGVLPSRENLHRNRFFPDKCDAGRVPVDVDQTPQRLIRGQPGEMSPNMVVVYEESKLTARDKAEGESGPMCCHRLSDWPRPVAFPGNEVRASVSGGRGEGKVGGMSRHSKPKGARPLSTAPNLMKVGS